MVCMGSIALLFLIVNPVSAHCPLCTIATGAAVSVTRFYGIDDLIVGTMIGAFTISTALWASNFLLRRNKGKNYIPHQKIVISALIFASTVISFYFFDTNPIYYKLFGVNRLLVGLVMGSIVTWVAFGIHTLLRKINSQKNYLPAQAIILVFIFLLILNTGLYLAGFLQ